MEEKSNKKERSNVSAFYTSNKRPNMFVSNGQGAQMTRLNV
jgi:hypothetical protein